MSSRILPRIAVCGISLEASTFSPALTTAAMLEQRRGEDVLTAWDFWSPGGSLTDRAEWIGVLQARGIAGGPIPADDYDALKREILGGLTRIHGEKPLDGLVLDLHGAASVVGLDDMEGDLALAVRAVVGPDVLISTGMDLHGNVSRTLAETLDLLTTYRTAPHIDWRETKERAARNLVDRLALPPARRRPAKAWATVPILLPGEMTSTRLEPATSLYARVPEIEALDGVLDAGIWIGYPWADEPRNMAVVMVTGDEADLALQQARDLAMDVWRRREEFGFVAPVGSLDEVLADALASPVTPYFISDSGDNPTAGGAGDVTWTLAHLLGSASLAASGRRAIYASIPDAAGAEAIARAGIGADVSVEVGARVDARHAPPVLLAGTVTAVAETPGNLEVVVATPAVDVIVTRVRRPYHLESDFTRLGLDPRRADLVVVKIGYLEPELFEMAAGWRMALTPGGVDQDLLRLGHQRIERPMFPFDREVADVDIAARAVLLPGRPDSDRAQLASLVAPTGTLRVVINLGNPVLAQGSADEPRGVTVAIAEDLAHWLEVPLQLECVDAARDSYAAITEGRVDLCFLANEPSREEGVAFTAPYVSIDGVYVASSNAPFDTSDQVDRDGVRIGVREGSAYDLFLSRTLQHAQIVRADEATDVYEEQGLEVAAGVRQPLTDYAASTGRRILEPPFMQINQAVGLPRHVDTEALAAVAARVEELKASGFIRDELARSGVSATVAPPA